MRWALRVAPGLAVFWVVLSGHFTPLILVLGALSVGLVAWVASRAGLDSGHVGLSPRQWLRLPRYLLWLGVEVLRASVAVSTQAWLPHPSLRPAVGLAPAPDLPELSQVIYANSITLTPGTLSMRLIDQGIRVHSLNRADLDSLQAGRMLDRVRRLGGR
jgi:multicomponent Na+:H+ antiporter subunit E